MKIAWESIERCLREHVHLIDYVYAITPYLRWYLNLLHKGLDIVHTIIGGGIKLMYTIRTAFLERHTRLTMPTWFHIFRRRSAVDSLGEDSSCTRLSDASRSAKEIGMGKLMPHDRVLERPYDIVLSDQILE